jgi:hypothetical protein
MVNTSNMRWRFRKQVSHVLTAGQEISEWNGEVWGPHAGKKTKLPLKIFGLGICRKKS